MNFWMSKKRGSWLLAETLKLETTQAKLAAARDEIADLRSQAASDLAGARALAGVALGLGAVGAAAAAALAAQALRSRRRLGSARISYPGVMGGGTGGGAGGAGRHGLGKHVDREAQDAAGGVVV
jgi:hypothetical protein